MSETLAGITLFHETLRRAVPNNQSAITTSRLFATSPHLAGSEQVGTGCLSQRHFSTLGTFHFFDCVSFTNWIQDLVTARQFLELFQRELGIKIPKVDPIFDAGSRESQHAIRSLTTKHHRQHTPSAWIDTYYPMMNRGVKQQLQILGKDGKPVWEANLEEIADMSDPGKSNDFLAEE